MTDPLPSKAQARTPMAVRILREFTDFPATTTIGALWIAVYLAMALYQGTLHAGSAWLEGGIETSTAHLFGDLTSRDLYAGEVWRTVTATFVHFSLIHLTLNLVGLYQLGRVVEDWHGSWRFVALYAAIGGVGNAIAGLARPFFPPGGEKAWLTHSGGGSTAIFGMVTLIGVGAWRSRTRFGDYAKGIALLLLLVNGVLAVVLRKYLDNLGHAGGAIVGAVLGLFQSALNHEPEGPSARRTGWIGIGVLAACAAAQGWDDRAEAQVRRRVVKAGEQEDLARRAFFRQGHLQLLYGATRERTRRGPSPLPTPRRPPRFDGGRKMEEIPLPALRETIRAALRALDADRGDLDSGPTAAAYLRIHQLGEAAIEKAPTPGQFHAFEAAWQAVHARASTEAEAARVTLQGLRPSAPPPLTPPR